jgi:hypothetical protein
MNLTVSLFFSVVQLNPILYCTKTIVVAAPEFVDQKVWDAEFQKAKRKVRHVEDKYVRKMRELNVS